MKCTQYKCDHFLSRHWSLRVTIGHEVFSVCDAVIEQCPKWCNHTEVLVKLGHLCMRLSGERAHIHIQ